MCIRDRTGPAGRRLRRFGRLRFHYVNVATGASRGIMRPESEDWRNFYANNITFGSTASCHLAEHCPARDAGARFTARFFGRGAGRTGQDSGAVSYTHLRAHETVLALVCRLLLEKKTQHVRHPIPHPY